MVVAFIEPVCQSCGLETARRRKTAPISRPNRDLSPKGEHLALWDLKKWGRELGRYLRGSKVMIASNPRPELPYRERKETCETLHLWTQVVGKAFANLYSALSDDQKRKSDSSEEF